MVARIFTVAAILACGVQADTLDRIAVTVGRDVIAESDVIRELKVDAFLDRKPVDLSPAAKRQAAERLVDQLIILREAADSHVTLPAAEIQAGLIAPYASESGYRTALERYAISEEDLGAHLLAGVRTLAFTKARFRSDVVVTADDVLLYYEKLRSQPGAALGPLPAFEAARDQIEQLLVDQRVIEALDLWLATTRSAARIQYRDKVFQ